MTHYIGRFAPSPSGPLHLGSLVTALGSYLQAKCHAGLWRLRIDDIDPPRVVAGATEEILDTLAHHGLNWDGPVYFQSDHLADYQRTLERLIAQNQAYRCDCTRKQIKAEGAYYQGTCRLKDEVSSPYAWRFKNPQKIDQFFDLAMGAVSVDPEAASEDFIIKRRDGLFAYHLASVVDDMTMGITEVVRGGDLLIPTACQIALFNALGANVPDFIHLPLVCFADGRKLSKQNHAPALDNTRAAQNVCEALGILHIDVPDSLHLEKIENILMWAQDKWLIKSVNNTAN